MAVQSVAATQDGRLAQLVRALPSHGRGQRFKSFVAHHFPIYSAIFVNVPYGPGHRCAEVAILAFAASRFPVRGAYPCVKLGSATVSCSFVWGNEGAECLRS